MTMLDTSPQQRSTFPIDDVIVVGGGLAGLFTALRLAPRRVTVLTAMPVGSGGSSSMAQGGIAAAMAPGDTVEKHLADTIAAGDGIVDEKIAGIMVGDAPARVHDLLEYGVPFDRDLEGRLAMSREAAHSERRVVHVKGDMAGAAIMHALGVAVRNTPSIRLVEGYVGESLMTKNNRVVGIVARPVNGGLAVEFPARAIVLASGGIGHLYAVSTNPPESEGGGMGMAARAGAVIADAEFVQFHPTALDVNRDPAPLASEALRGEGALLINKAGERFMVKQHPLAELAPRDVVARAVHNEIVAGRGAFLDTRQALGAEIAEKFPTVFRYCLDAGIDPVTQPMPIAPAEHYHMGGVLTDADGRTTLDGLWACGEVASTGVHGANRLASNSLLEAVAFATRAAVNIAAHFPQAELMEARTLPDDHAPQPDADDWKLLRGTMSNDVGVVRNREGMERALSVITSLDAKNRSPRFRNSLAAARMVAAGALNRTESRGGHYRSDYPEPDPVWHHRTFMTLAEAEGIAEHAPAPAE
jgi:L-aspartate oxidase